MVNRQILENLNKSEFDYKLLQWFDENKRVLPWRLTKNPYHIWISEVMLQQTQVDTVIPYYERFLKEFPTPYHLAEAPQEQVLKAWEGLGYYSRARNLQAGVQEVVEQYQGHVPDTKKEILNIKGIGPYTAGAILSIAYDKPEPAVDGNVMRVLSRVFNISDDITQVKTRRKFEAILYELIPDDAASDFNQALMELGALVCKPKNPQCEICPLESLCKAKELGNQTMLPVKKKAKGPKELPLAAVVLFDKNGRVLIQKRPDSGLLASLWEFPMIELPEAELNSNLAQYCEEQLSKELGIQASLEKIDIEFTHTFSHLKWQVSVVRGYLDKSNRGPNQWELLDAGDNRRRFVKYSELDGYPFPVVHQKIIQALSLPNSEG